jgi:hypothetical protein
VQGALQSLQSNGNAKRAFTALQSWKLRVQPKGGRWRGYGKKKKKSVN